MTGVWNKKHRTSMDMLHYYHNATVPQLNFLHEISSQHLGHPPSHSWGQQEIPWRFHNVEPETWDFIRKATRHPVHEYARQMTMGTDISKKAGSVSGAIIDAIKAGGKAALKYGTVVVKTLIKHQDEIKTGIKVGKTVADLASTIGLITGAIKPETHDKVKKVTGAVEKAVNRFGKQPEKKKGGWVDYENFT